MQKTTQIEATFQDAVDEAYTYGVPAVCIGDLEKDESVETDLIVCGSYPDDTAAESILDLLIRTIGVMKDYVGKEKEDELQTKILALYLSWALQDDEERIRTVTRAICKALDDVLMHQQSEEAVSKLPDAWKAKYRKN